MGNAGSDAAEAAAMERVETLRNQLADMERAVRLIHHQPQIDVLLPHQLRVFGHIISSNDHVRVLLGPVVGRVDPTNARVVLEVDRDATLTGHVLIHDARTDAWAEFPQCSVMDHPATARRPTVFRISSLLPGRRYRVVFSGIHREDAMNKTASFYTPTRADGGSLHCAVVSGDDMYELEYGERSLWQDLKRAVVDEQRVQLVLHLGGQVAMKRMFDKAWALLVRHAECVAPPVAMSAGEHADTAFARAWASLEDQATEILRSAYRTQWTMMNDKASVLANASNLMIWSDWDVYPAFTTNSVFFVDHKQPTLEMQVLRTVVRCARRLYQEYQRALWDDDLDQVFEREVELRRIAEQALATTARIYQLGLQIPTAQADLELQKKRREIEGARKAERHLRSLEAEKTKSEKILVSYNQLLAPQAGEEYFYTVGVVGFLFVDMRSSRLEAGGSQRAESEVLSNVQWASIERVLEDEAIQHIFVCSESPLVDDLPHELRTTLGSDRECDFKTWWGSNSSAQQRLLGLMFEWKLHKEGRNVMLLSGSSNTRFGMKTIVRDTRLRTDLVQWMVGPLTARASGQAIPSRTGTLFDRYSFEHCEVEALEKSLLYLDVDPPKNQSIVSEIAKKNLDVTVTRVDATTVQDPAHVIVGPVVGHVDAISAIVVLEVDRTCDVVCVIMNVLTGECHRFFQHFEANRPNSFFLNHLRSEHYYEVSFDRIQNPSQHQCSFTTLAKVPLEFQLLVIGPMELPAGTNTASVLADRLTTRSIWPWINENISMGLPFRGVDKMIHFDNAYLEDTAQLKHLVQDERGDNQTIRDIIMAQVREAQRLKWNMPGVRQMLARGSHIMLMADDLFGVPEDGKQLIVRDCITQVQLEYENLLLPPSKRVSHIDKRLASPIQFVFGAYGLFVLPNAFTRTMDRCESLWDRLNEFLKTPLLSFVGIVSTRPIIEDSVEDVEEKARFDTSYRHTLAFQQEKLARLLDVLFAWQQQAQMGRTCDHRVVFICSHHSRSFDSILHDIQALTKVPRTPGFRQFVVGPFRQPHSPTNGPSLQMNVFPQGTLFEKYGYYHRFQRSGVEGNPTLDDDKAPTTASSSHHSRIWHSGFLHVQALQKRTVDDRSLVEIVPTFVVTNNIHLVPPPATIAFTDDEELRIRVVGPECREPRWTIETRSPEWLTSVISQPLTEEEEAMLNQMNSLLTDKTADVEVAFQRADTLAKGLVSADDRPNFVAHLRASIEDFHKHIAGMAFRSVYPVVPSAYVVNYTLQEMPTISGAIDLEQYQAILIKCLQNAALFDARLNSFWS